MAVKSEELQQSVSGETLRQAFDIKKESEFIQACSRGDLKAISELLTQDASLVNKPATNGVSPLMLAARNGHLKVVEQLLQEGAKIDEVVETGKNQGVTALLSAACYKRWDVVKLLLEQGARNLDVSLKEGPMQGITALLAAAYCQQWDLVKLLLKYGARNLDASPKEGPNRGVTALWYAAHCQQWDLVKLLLKYGVRNLDAGPPEKRLLPRGTVLQMVFEQGKDELFRQLLAKGVSSVSLKFLYSNTEGWLGPPGGQSSHRELRITFENVMALFELAGNDSKLKDAEIQIRLKKVLSNLFEGRAINGRIEGETALHVAIRKENWPVIEALVLAGADLLLANNDGRTAQSLLSSSSLVQAFAKLQNLRTELENWLLCDKFKGSEGKESKERKEQREQYAKESQQLVNELLKAGQRLEQPLHRNQFYYQLGELLHEKREQGLVGIPVEVVLKIFSQVSDETVEIYQKACSKRVLYGRVIGPVSTKLFSVEGESTGTSGIKSLDEVGDGKIAAEEEISRAVMAVSAGSAIEGEDVFQTVVRAVLGEHSQNDDFPTKARTMRESERELTPGLALEKAFSLLRERFRVMQEKIAQLEESRSQLNSPLLLSFGSLSGVTSLALSTGSSSSLSSELNPDTSSEPLMQAKGQKRLRDKDKEKEGRNFEQQDKVMRKK